MAAPYRPPSASPPPPQAPPRRRHSGIVGPMVLIFIGGVFLLQNLGYLPPTAWMNIWRLWPLLLVLAGLELLFAGRLPWLILAALALAVLVVGTLTLGPGMPLATPASVTDDRDTALGGASQASVALRFGAGQLTVGPLVGDGAATLASMHYSGPSDLEPVPRYTVSGSSGDLSYQASGRGASNFMPFTGDRAETQLDVDLATGIPITSLVVQTGATDAHLDLSNLQISSLDVSLGAANAWIRLPQRGTTTARINGGAASITLEIPQGVAAQIRHRGGLSTLSIDQSRFPQTADGLYRSPDYDTSPNKVDLDLETGITTIRVQ